MIYPPLGMMKWNRTGAVAWAAAHTSGQWAASEMGCPPGRPGCFCGHCVSSPGRVSVKENTWIE